MPLLRGYFWSRVRLKTAVKQFFEGVKCNLGICASGFKQQNCALTDSQSHQIEDVFRIRQFTASANLNFTRKRICRFRN